MREFQLLLCCARTQVECERVRHFIRQGLDWQRFIELATQHRVRPLVTRSLKSACWDELPSSAQVQLETFYNAGVRRNLFFAVELLRLAEVCRQAGVPVAVFKGPVLAEQVYGDLSLREFMDLDLFVREQDVRKAEQILTAGGYTTYMAGEAYRSAFLSYYGQQPFIHANTGVVVDLHWRLASKNVAIPIEPVDLWKRLQNVTLLGRPLPTLAPPDLVLFLAAHGSMHGWGCLIWVCDIAEFLRKHQKVDWDAIFKLATRSHSVRPLLSGIFLAHTLLDAPVPGELLSKARTNSAVQTLAEKARLKMHRPVPHGDFAEFLHGLSTHDLVRDRLWPVATLLLTRTVNDHQAMPLPKSLWGMYHLTRPFRLAGKAAQMFKAVSD